MSSKEQKFFCQSKIVSEKLFRKRQKQVECAKNLKVENEKFTSNNLKFCNHQYANVEKKVYCNKQNYDASCSTTSNPSVINENKYLIQ